MTELALPPGYELERLLGRSPLSEVFLVRDPQGRQRALKLLRPSACRDPRLLARFEREVQLLEDTHHPNLVQGHGALRVDGRPGLLLEYIDGPTLRDAVQAGPLGWEQAARYGVQLARALDRLHRLGALHRDVKPHNVLLDPRRGAVLADLGLVRRTQDPELTRHGAALGSPAYMSPEQARDPSGVGPEADVYSLGATLHHALAGAPPFLGKGVGEVIHRVLHEEPEPLPGTVPEPLQRVLATALAKDPERRYARARDLAADLGRVLLGSTPQLLTRHRHRRRQQLLAGLVATPLLLGAGLLLWQSLGLGLGLPAGAGEEPERVAREGAGDPAGDPASRAATARDVSSQRELYETWAGESLRRVRQAYEEGAFRLAWQSLDLFEQRAFPPRADLGLFEQLRRGELQRQRSTLEQRAAEVFVDVAEVLQARSDDAREAIRAGSFDPEAWRRETLAELETRVPRARQLPLYPGGESPTELVQSYQLTLERQNREAWSSRAASLLPDLRAQIAGLLRSEDLQAAWALWEQVDPRLLEHSLEARREGWRMERLIGAERALAAQMSSRLGRPWTVALRSGEVSGRVSLPAEGSVHWRIDPEGGARIEVQLLELAPRALERIFSFAEPEREWLRAQLAWAQGEVGTAVDGMRRLALRSWPAEADPYFWAAEWERELALLPGPEHAGAEPPAAGPPVAPASTEPTPASPADPVARFAAELRAELLDAQVTVSGDQVEVVWSDQDLHPSWLRTWGQDPRRWRLASWELQWELPLQSRPPERFQLWGDVLCRRQGSAWELRVDGERTSGVVLVPGARQTLAWDGERVRFDGFAVGDWEPREARRLLLRAEASSSFRASQLRVVMRPVRP